MIPTTQSFYDNSVFKYRNTNYSINIKVFDNTAKSDIDQISVNESRLFYQSQVYDSKQYTTGYATGELGGFFLNGETLLLPDTITDEQIGWWTPLSDEDGLFDVNPTITIEFEGVHSSAGITCLWDQYSYPINSICYWYNGSTLLHSAELDGNSYIQVFDHAVNNYNKIVIEITEAKPYCYCKLATIEYGLEIEFTQDELQGATLTEKTSIMSNTVSPNELVFNIIDYDYRYNVFDTTNLFKYFKFGQEVNVTAGVLDQDVEVFENISMGKYYVDTATVDNGILTIKAFGVLNLLNGETFYSPFYTDETVQNIVDDILNGYDHFVHENVANIQLTGFIPTQSKKEALKAVALACNAVIKEDRDGKIVIYKATEDFSSNQVITNDTEYYAFSYAANPPMIIAGVPTIYDIAPVPHVFTVYKSQRLSQIKTSLIGTYSECDVTYLTYGQNDEETTTYKILTDNDGKATITHEPMEVTGSSVAMSHYVDCSLFSGTPNTEYTVTITGKKYFTDETVVSAVDNTGISNDDAKLVMELNQGNTLIASQGIAKDCAEWYLSQLKKRKDISFTWYAVATVEAPDYINVETSDGTISTMQINEIKYDLYTLNAEVKGVMS